RQSEIISSITTIKVNFNKDSDSRKNAEYIKKRLGALDALWEEFEQNHSRISDHASEADEYFRLNTYQVGKDLYQSVRILLSSYGKSSKSTQPDGEVDELLAMQRTNFRALSRLIKSIKVENISDKWELEDELNGVQSIWKIIDAQHLKIDHILAGGDISYDEEFTRHELAYKNIKLHRYNNEQALFTHQIEIFLNQPNIQKQSSSEIKRLYDTTTECIHAIHNLGVNTNAWDPLLVHLLCKKLDTDTQTDYREARVEPRKLPKLDELMTFLEGFNHRNYQAQAIHISKCALHNQIFVKIAYSLTTEMNVLPPNVASLAKAIIIPYSMKRPNANHVAVDDEELLLTTLSINVRCSDGTYITLRALLDQGSQISLISENAVQRLGLQRRRYNASVSGIGSGASQSKGLVSIDCQSIYGDYNFTTEALVLSRVASNLPSVQFKKQSWPHLQHLQLADPEYNVSKPIDLLLDSIIVQLEQEISEIEHYDMLLKNTNEAPMRLRRGLVNGVGYIANSLFGVLDERFAEKYKSDIEQISHNEKHLQNLIKNQTSIMESEFNILRRNENVMNKQFSFINQRLQDLAREVYEVRLVNQDNNYITSSSLAASIILSNLRWIQQTLIGTVTDISHGRIDSHLLSPEQLSYQLSIISSQLNGKLTIPVDIKNIKDLYRLLKVSARKQGQHYYQFLTSVSFIAYNLHKDTAFLLSEEDLKSCTHIPSDILLCSLNMPIYDLKMKQSICDIKIINHAHLCNNLNIHHHIEVPEVSMLNRIMKTSIPDNISMVEDHQVIWDQLRAQIDEVKEQSSTDLSIHDVHHYTVLYISVAAVIILGGVVVYLIRSRRAAARAAASPAPRPGGCWAGPATVAPVDPAPVASHQARSVLKCSEVFTLEDL
ncbi:hypothetical protein HW555_014301, partial [Spodoptera exigua]